MTKRRSVMDRLRSAWEENPGSVAEVAEQFVPEANRREIEEVDRAKYHGSGGCGPMNAIKRGRPKPGEPDPIPNGQRRVIRKYDPFRG